MDGGPSIRDYIDARKKSGMSWEEFRALKDKNEGGTEFSDSAMLAWRKQLDSEREARLNKERPQGDGKRDKKSRQKRSGRKNEKCGSDGEADGGRHEHRRSKRHHSSHKSDKRPRKDRGRSRSKSPDQARDKDSDRHGHQNRPRHQRRSQSPDDREHRHSRSRKSTNPSADTDSKRAGASTASIN
ncbi:hypothetical protein GGI04_000857 [Coemansia thaxteri]|nr:hypothetical protein GGI04_000857 [Coemansia thaxteri]KAJ2473545.1 hypothetical protein GGI02_000765 [Coemansia sp. RSA 2322]